MNATPTPVYHLKLRNDYQESLRRMRGLEKENLALRNLVRHLKEQRHSPDLPGSTMTDSPPSERRRSAETYP